MHRSVYSFTSPYLHPLSSGARVIEQEETPNALALLTVTVDLPPVAEQCLRVLTLVVSVWLSVTGWNNPIIVWFMVAGWWWQHITGLVTDYLRSNPSRCTVDPLLVQQGDARRPYRTVA
jgi:hypothetical protein